jgi:hypothetical protein
MVIVIEVVVLARNRLTRDGERGGGREVADAGREKGRVGVEREKKKNKKRK